MMQNNDQIKLWGDNTSQNKMIDEYYSPQHTAVQNLTNLVESEMRAAGLDPNNEDHIKQFWLNKGIGNA